MGRIITLLRRGCKSRGELIRKLESLDEDEPIPEAIRKRISRYLEELVTWRLVTKNQRGEWCWYTSTRIFQSEGEYYAALQHSYSLISVLQQMAEAPLAPDQVLIEPEHVTLVEKHLESGYPEIYNLLIQVRDGDTHLQGMKQRLEVHVETAMIAKFKEYLDRAAGPQKECYVGTNLPQVLIERLLAENRGCPTSIPWEDPNHQLCLGDQVIGRGLQKRNLEEFITTQRMDEAIVGGVKQIISREQKQLTLSSTLTGQLQHIILLITHGTPLEGSCLACPTFIIQRGIN